MLKKGPKVLSTNVKTPVSKKSHQDLIKVPVVGRLRTLSTRVFETLTETGSKLFSILTCPHTTTFSLPGIFSPLEMSCIKTWETIRSKKAKCSLPAAVRVSKTRVLKLHIREF